MLGHLVIDLIDRRAVPVGPFYACLQIIGYKQFTDTAEEPVHVDMSGDPAFLIAGKKSFDVGILAIGESRHKDVRRDYLSGFVIDDSRCLSRPVNFDLFARFPLDVHGRPLLQGILLIVVAKLGVHQGLLVSQTTVGAIFRPEEPESNPGFSHLFMDVLQVRLPACNRHWW